MRLTITFSIVPKWQHRTFTVAQVLSAGLLPSSLEAFAGVEFCAVEEIILAFAWMLASWVAAGLPIYCEEESL